MSAAVALQEAAIAALQGVAELGIVHDGQPLQAAFPHATVEAGPERDWGHKSGVGREVRLAVTIRDAGQSSGEQPTRLKRLMSEVEAAVGGLSSVEGWQLVTLHFLSSRLARDRQSGWIGLIEYRARMLAL